MVLIRESEYQEKMREAEAELAAVRVTEKLCVKDGELSVYCYFPPDMRAVLLLLHGTTESAEKYHEMIWYFVQNGIGVAAPDMRGHGKSLRLVEDPYLVHVERFEDYVDDAEMIVNKMLDSLSKPIYLFGHSLGGAVAASLMLRMPERFSHVVLCSPMVDPSSGSIPRWIGVLIARFSILIGCGKKMVFVSSPYNPEKNTFEASCDTGKARFEYYKAKRIREKAYQTSGISYRWTAESFGVKRMLLNHPNIGALHAKVLLCQAGKDTVVCLPAQDAFAAKLPDARVVRFDDAKHEIGFSEDSTMERFMNEILRFFGAEPLQS